MEQINLDAETEEIVQRIAKETGEAREDVVARAVRGLQQARPTPEPSGELPPEEQARRRKLLRGISERGRRRPILDDRTPDEIIGYDENGMPS